MSDAHSDDATVATTPPTIGSRLQKAREAKKYSVAEVAAQLRLNKDIVTYMENQQWDKLHGRTYARGYFASYVKFLGLPFDEMLAVFNDEYQTSEPSLNLFQHGHDQLDRQFPWFMLALIATVMVVIWLAFQQWQQTQVVQQASMAEIDNVEEEDNFSTSIVDPSDAIESSNEPMISSAEQTAEQLGISANNLDEITATEVVSSTSAAVEKNSQMMVTDQQANEPVSTEESTLQLSFSGECWVEVTNADSQVLVSKVMRADQSLLLKSDQPLSILLGRAKAASVTYNNQTVDLSPYMQGDLARLTLGVES